VGEERDPSGDGAISAVRISSTSQRVRVVAEPREDVEVDGPARVRVEGGVATVDHVEGRLLVRVPVGIDVAVGASSGRVRIEGRVGAVSVVTGSGRIDVATAKSIDVRSGSARVEIGEVEDDCHVRVASGRVVVGRCGSADVAGESGRIEVHESYGPVHAHCVSGRIDVNMMTADDVDAETVSGRVNVSLPPGVTAISGDEAGDDPLPEQCCVVSARSVRGRVSVGSR
jgi:hypothetical protein